ncbi:MAG: hypothetical protein SGBAC_003792 [Bacillariaceae sp.]
MADQVQQPNESRGYATAQTSTQDQDDRHRRHKEKRSRSDRKDSSSHHRKRSRSRKRENKRYDNDDNDVNRRSHKRRRRNIGDSSADHSTGLKPRWQRQQETSRQNSSLGVSTESDPAYNKAPQRRAAGVVPMFLPRQQGERPRLNLAVKQSRGGVIVAQAMKSKGPDGSVGFVPGWTTRKSRFTETKQTTM